MSDVDSSYKEIEDIQKFYFLGERNPFLKVVDRKKISRTLHGALEKLDRYKTQIPPQYYADYKQLIISAILKYKSGSLTTRYQDPLSYYIIYTQIISNMQKIAAALYPKVHYEPKFGTFYSSTISAERKSGHQSYLLIVDYRFVIFCNQMARLAVNYKNFEDLINARDLKNNTYYFYHIQHEIDTSAGIKRDFLLTIANYFDPSLLPRRPVDSLRIYEEYSTYLASAMAWFVLGHEYAHALMKHSISDEDSKNNVLNDTICLRSWINEIQADSISQKMLDLEVDQYNFEKYNGAHDFRRFGGCFYFSFLNIYEQAKAISNHERSEEPNGQEIHLLYKLFDPASSYSEKLNLFSQLPAAYRRQLHPPTKFRLYLLQRMCDRSDMQSQAARELIVLNDVVWQKVQGTFLRLLAKPTNYPPNMQPIKP